MKKTKNENIEYTKNTSINHIKNIKNTSIEHIKNASIDHKALINRIKVAIIVFLCVLLCIIQLFSLIKGNAYDKYTLTKDVVVKHNGKKVYEGDIDEYKMKNIKSEDNLTMYMNIPKNSLTNPAIQYDNINTAVKIYVDENQVYSIGKDVEEGGIVCHAFNKAPLGDLTGKKQVIMSVRVMNNSTLTRLPRVYMMNTYDIDADYYYSMHIYIVIGYFFAIIGILGLVIVSFLWQKDILTKKMLVLSITCIVSSIYMIAMFQVIPLFSNNYVLDTYLEYSMRMYLPMMLNLYMCFNYPKGKRKLSTILTVLSGTHATIALILQGLKIMYVNDTMQFCLLMYICAGINIVLYYIKYKKSSFSKKALVGISSVVFVLVLVYVTVHLFFSNYSDYFLVIVPMAVLVVLTTFYMELISEITSNIISNAKKRALEETAYLDGLTRIPNRRGYEIYIATRLSKNTTYKVYSFDLNKLKYVNDNYGHGCGDEYIRTFASKLKEVYVDGFCARLGGDEFVAIIDSKKVELNVDKSVGENTDIILDKNAEQNKDKITDSIMKTLREKIDEYNKNDDKEYKLAYSVGDANYSPGKDNIEEVMKVADEKMYKMKEVYR